jgi:Xaa-Pro dipeptidase
MHRIKKRISTVFNNIWDTQPPDAFFLFNGDRVDKNFIYITGLYNGVFENCGVLCERSGKIYLLSSALEEEAVRAQDNQADIVVYKNQRERNEKLKNLLSGYKKLGICFNGISHSFFNYLQETSSQTLWVDVGKAFRQARMIKFDDEIERISRACSVVSEIADSIGKIFREGITELDISAEIDYMMKKGGADGASFKTIVAFSKNASMPHYSGSDVPLQNGDVILIDFGAEYRGYVSDITRTYLTGKPEKEILNLYDTVVKAQQIAIDLMKPGASTENVEFEVKKFIDSDDRYRGRFIHSLGHSIGLDVHDDGYPSDDFQKKFGCGMVLTVEPGIYLPGQYGIRIEDDVLIEEDGRRLLTSAKKEPFAYEI